MADTQTTAPGLVMEALKFEVPQKGVIEISGVLLPDSIVTVRGPSGCGKSTFLRTLAGLNPANSGKLSLGGRDLTNLPTYQRRCGLVFQSGALFPHLNVRENLLFGMKLFFRNHAEAVLLERVIAMLKNVGLEDFLDREIGTLSGGEKQRVALARSLLCEPEYLLLDEPLSALDPENRGALQELILRLHSERPIPTLFVTHDSQEAMRMGGRTIEWKEGSKCLEF